jgi:Ser/Thr protein kinase RdoA (MazF antagonist)
MAPAPALTPLLKDVLAEFGVEPEGIHDIRSGRVNKHWRVVARDATYALRRYTPVRSADAIAYEHDVLRHLDALDWPVAAPIESPRGATAVSHEGHVYSLFPFLAGRAAPYGSLPHLRIKGALLARLHHDLERTPPTKQRDGFGRAWELDVYVRAATQYASLTELLTAFARQHADLASAIRRQKYAVLRELARLGYGELPDQLVHVDFHHDNVLFQRAKLSALLDFDLVHRDSRVTDIATSIALDCLEPPGYNAIAPEAAQAFVCGYLERQRLDERELRLIVPLVRAHILGLVVYRLNQWPEGHRDVLRSVDRSMSQRFPAFAERRADLERAVAQAAAGVHT